MIEKKNDAIYPSGMYPQTTHPNAPDYVIRPVSTIRICPTLSATWLQNESWWKKHVIHTDKSGNEYIDLNIKQSREQDKFGNDSYYFALRQNKEVDPMNQYNAPFQIPTK